MRIEKKEIKQREIEFAKIYDGACFICGDKYYIKGDGVYAVELETGHVVQPLLQNLEQFNHCYLKTHACFKI